MTYAETFLDQVTDEWQRAKDIGVDYYILDELVQGGFLDVRHLQLGHYNPEGRWIGRGGRVWFRLGTGKVIVEREGSDGVEVGVGSQEQCRLGEAG